MKKTLVLVVSILAAVVLLSNIVIASPPLMDPVISGKIAEAQMLVDDCTRMHKISRPAAVELHSRINYYRERALNTEIRHGGFIPPHESRKLNDGLDRLIREVADLRNAPPLPPVGPPPPLPPLR
ncbi:hypothetical protein [Candidatus Magnetominusculus xianensis]|uniref:Secreted protein n=1 Tax=Candidatus Magnetominusculus xianensis TaxID=1748249 RepID=A0ABR5SCS0_9BACT|nr:hypothetical protein [Candidatus Magnetominusculus xianensis]KWT82093.1 hypothetical protein ASN18_2542 [Candidatus Magnetominusculus xianensis]MBF0405478.1 hypothetical protein [Nitrospirota bacterium]